MNKQTELSAETRKVLNRTAREQMKLKLLADIRTDLIVCELEGWNKKEYLNELKELINNLLPCEPTISSTIAESV